MSVELSAGWWLTTHGGVELLRWSNDAELWVTDDGLGWFASSGQGAGNRIGTTLAQKLEKPECFVQGTEAGYVIIVRLPDAKRLTVWSCGRIIGNRISPPNSSPICGH